MENNFLASLLDNVSVRQSSEGTFYLPILVIYIRCTHYEF